MPIYTRTGDDGTTGLCGGKRIFKSDLIVDAYGTLDECTSYLGLVTTKKIEKQDRLLITQIQKDMYAIMGFLAGANLDLHSLGEHIVSFEDKIDASEKKLPRLKNFILPQGAEISVQFHISRTVCRRAERAMITYVRTSKHLFTDHRFLMVV
ncbi:ATP:cob(I)alamin adenosyltransferase, partial [Candidatus Collierbacteria bacterium CG1_02_44_10]